MNKEAINEVLVYHDETKDVARGKYRGHILFFVPTRLIICQDEPLFGASSCEYSPFELLFEKLCNIREQYKINKKLHFNDISGQRWGKFDLGVRNAVAIGVDALRRKFPQIFRLPLSCKVAVIFYPKKTDLSLYGGSRRKERQLRHDETVLRMLLKGATHYLYDAADKVVVKRIISDGLPGHRSLDHNRIIWQITVDEISGRTPLREHVRFAEDAEIVHLPSDHKKYPPHCEEHAHANMLQLADLLLGSIIRSCHVGCQDWQQPPRIGSKVETKRDIIAYPVKEMLSKEIRGRGFTRSGHYKAFSVSCLSLADSEINFSQVRALDVQITCDNLTFNFP